MKHTRLVLVIACALFAGQPSTFAQSIVPDDGQNPDEVEQLGYATHYSVTGFITGRPFNVYWYGRQTDSVTPQDFAANPDGSNFGFRNPGSFEIKAVIKYGTVSRPGDVAPPDQTVIYPITIPPPTVAQILGTNQAAPWAPPDKDCPPPYDAQGTGPNELGGIPGQWMYFVLKSKGKPIGPANNLGAQEKITQFFKLGVKQADSDWRPNTGKDTDPPGEQGSNSNFGKAYLQTLQTVIADFKCTKAPQAPTGPVDPITGQPTMQPQPSFNGDYIIYYQENRVFWTDNSNVRVDGPSLGTKVWRFKGNGDGTWTATASDLPPQ